MTRESDSEYNRDSGLFRAHADRALKAIVVSETALITSLTVPDTLPASTIINEAVVFTGVAIGALAVGIAVRAIRDDYRRIEATIDTGTTESDTVEDGGLVIQGDLAHSDEDPPMAA